MILILSLSLSLISIFFFFSYNFFFLYIFFELSLVPILIIIIGFGMQIEKISSSFYLIFYAILTTFPFLFIYFKIEEFPLLTYLDFIFSDLYLFFFCLGFLMKFPIFFLHYWLPKAHVESPTVGSILLAGLLLKLGTLGFSRMLKSLSYLNLFNLLFISIVGMIFCSLICIFQRDSKALVAYSSIVHMSFLLLGLIFFSTFSKNSRLLIILVHGYISVIIFFLVGEYFHNNYTRLIYYFNRLFISNLFICFLLSFFFLLNRGFPINLSFFSEIFGIFSFIHIFVYLFFFIFVYFFFSFYYCLFFLLFSFLGKNFIIIKDILIIFILPYLLMCFNLLFIF